MKPTIDLDYVYDRLGGPARLRRNFPRESQFGSPSLDEQCEAFPWANVDTVLRQYFSEVDEGERARYWPHLASALHEYRYQPLDKPLPLLDEGTRSTSIAYERIAKKVQELSDAIGDLDRLSNLYIDDREGGREIVLDEIYDRFWTNLGQSKWKQLDDQAYDIDPRLDALHGAWSSPDTQSRSIVDLYTSMTALSYAAGQSAKDAHEQRTNLRRLSGPSDLKLLYLMDTLARVWISAKNERPSSSTGKPSAVLFTNFVTECSEIDSNGDRHAPAAPSADKVASYTDYAASRAARKMAHLKGSRS